MGKKPPAFQFYAPEWLSSTATRSMSLEERGAYIDMLCHAWLHGSVPECPTLLARVLGVTRGKAKRLLQGPLRSCWIKHPQRPFELVNEKLEEVRQDRDEYTEAKRKAGVASGVARRAKSANTRSTRVRTNGSTNANPPTPSPSGSSLQSREQVLSPSERPPRRLKAPTKPHAIAVQTWMDLWVRHRGEEYAFQGAKDGSAVSRVLKFAKGDMALVESRMRRLIEDPPDPWYAQNASLALLASRWNELGVVVTPKTRHEIERDEQDEALLRGLAKVRSRKGKPRLTDGK